MITLEVLQILTCPSNLKMAISNVDQSEFLLPKLVALILYISLKERYIFVIIYRLLVTIWEKCNAVSNIC